MLILLIGPKGSGKSHIGRLLESEFGVHFFHVEPLWMQYHAECVAMAKEPSIEEGVARIHPAIAGVLREYDTVCVETTGASRVILDDLLALGKAGPLLRVGIRASLPVCLERIASRDSSAQIELGRDEIAEVHRLSTSLTLDFDLVIENESLSETEILESFRDMLDQ